MNKIYFYGTIFALLQLVLPLNAVKNGKYESLEEEEVSDPALPEQGKSPFRYTILTRGLDKVVAQPSTIESGVDVRVRWQNKDWLGTVIAKEPSTPFLKSNNWEVALYEEGTRKVHLFSEVDIKPLPYHPAQLELLNLFGKELSNTTLEVIKEQVVGRNALIKKENKRAYGEVKDVEIADGGEIYFIIKKPAFHIFHKEVFKTKKYPIEEVLLLNSQS